MSKFSSSLKHLFYTFVFCLALWSCKKETIIEVSDYQYQSDKTALIEVNIQTLTGTSKEVKIINQKLNHFVCNAFYIDASNDLGNSIEDCANQFNDSYTNFKAQFSKELAIEIPKYEAFVDGELSYQNELLLCFAMSSSINTGGSQPITKITFLNFDIATSKLLTFNDLVSNKAELLNVMKPYLEKELFSSSYKIEEFTQNGSIKAPDHFGYDDLGVVAFYETPNNNFIEFSVPFDKVEDFLNY